MQALYLSLQFYSDDPLMQVMLRMLGIDHESQRDCTARMGVSMKGSRYWAIMQLWGWLGQAWVHLGTGGSYQVLVSLNRFRNWVEYRGICELKVRESRNMPESARQQTRLLDLTTCSLIQSTQMKAASPPALPPVTITSSANENTWKRDSKLSSCASVILRPRKYSFASLQSTGVVWWP